MNKLDNSKGVAGLNVYLSLIAMLFMIGIIVMVFQIAGSKLADSSRVATSGLAEDEAVADVTAGHTLADSLTKLNFRSPTLVAFYNSTNDTIGLGNFTITDNVLINTTAVAGLGVTNGLINYTYVFDAESGASLSINETKGALGESTGFFGIFIVLGAMVVLILLVVIIINSIRATGITEGA